MPTRLWRLGRMLPLTVRKAAMHDIRPILELINGYAAKGIMLPRTEFEMSESIRDFTVVRRGGELLGCGALHFYSPTIGEIRSLAVHEHAKTHGVGRQLIEALTAEAQEYQLDAVFAVHLRGGVLRKGRLPRRGARRAAAEGLERLPSVSQVPGLR